jgi:hypothetical protein
MAQATLKQSFGALLAAATTAANVAEKSLNVVNNGVDMAQRSVSASAETHKLDLLAELHVYKHELAERTKQRRAKVALDSIEFRNQSQQHADLYDLFSPDVDKLLGL